VIFVANALFLVFWMWVGKLHAYGPDARPINSYDAISLQITILGIIITAMAIGLAIASIFGYQALRESMLSRAESLVNTRLDNHPLFKGIAVGGAQSSPAAPAGGAGEVVEEGEHL
jgi:hypothetical protein